jgi:hypothetical protein
MTVTMDGAVRGFASLINGLGSPLGITLMVLLMPLVTFAHELGHALVGLSRTEGLVTVEVGRKPALWRARSGRLVLALHPVPAFATFEGRAGTYARMSPQDRLVYALAGPMAHAAAALLVILVGLRVHSHAAVCVGLVYLVTAASNLIPFKHSGMRSDGAIALAAWKDRGHAGARTVHSAATVVVQSELDETAARWLVAFTDQSNLNTKKRGEALGGAPVALGYAPTDRSPNAVGLWKLAYAGWCWREAERGHYERVREAALDAVHRATVTGAVGPSLTALAARDLAINGTNLGLASPGTDDNARSRFSRTAFERLPANLRTDTVRETQRWFAFRYGIALHDVERARG